MIRIATSTFCDSTSLKCARSMRSSRASLRATAVAKRGWSSRIAISPKKSPASRLASGSAPLRARRISTVPVSMMYISVPASPSRNTGCPAATVR